MSGPGPCRLSSPSPFEELQAALAPLPALANGDPDKVFAVAGLLHPAEQKQLVAIFPMMLPALVSRAQALERNMEFRDALARRLLRGRLQRVSLLHHVGEARACPHRRGRRPVRGPADDIRPL